jgi:hypothetical protein
MNYDIIPSLFKATGIIPEKYKENSPIGEPLGGS